MKKVLAIILLLALNLITLPLRNYALDESGEELKLFMGEAKIIEVNNPTRIVIGNPDIADVINVTKSEITLSPKAAGSTTLVFWDNFGEQFYKVKVITEDMDEVKQRIDYLLGKLNLPNVYTQPAEDEGKVMLLGAVKNPQDRERISVALGTLKDKILDLIELKEEEAVVEIDVQILELNKGATNTLGLTWPGSINLAEKGSAALTGTGSKWSTLFQALNFQRATVSSGTYTGDPFTFKLDALIQEGKARILSRPRLACQSGKEAELLVGGEKPTFTTSTTTIGTSSTVQYKEYGIKLKIKPNVTEDNRIKLALNVEVSDVGEAVTIGGTNTTGLAYPLTKRNASTELYLNNGQTMAIGGLIKQKSEEALRKLPWLADVPVLGMFFRQRTTTTGKGATTKDDTELFITLTPTIVSKETPETKVDSAKKIIPEEAASFQTKDIPSNLTNYVKAVQAKIVNAIYYPRQAKEAGWEGNVTLSLNLNSSGYLKEIKIAQSSGYKIIDEAALEVAGKLAPYPPFPPQIESSELWVEVPIQYKKD